jgi:hypothetical protein
MPRITVLVAIVILSLAFVLLWGCSDDDKSVNPPPVPTEGELTDVRFLFIDEVSEPDIMRTTEISLLSSIFFLLRMPSGLSARDAVSPFAASPADLTGLVINSLDTPIMSTEGWYVFDYDITVTYENTDTIDAVGVDSVRLLLNDSPVPWIGYTTRFDGQQVRDRAVWSDNRAYSGTSRHNLDLLLVDSVSGVYDLEIAVADTTHTFIEDDSGACYVNLYRTGTGTSIQLYPQGGYQLCADSGTVTMNTVVDLDCTEHSQTAHWGVEGLWVHKGTYSSAYVQTCKLTHGNTFWNFVDSCNFD